MLLLRPANNSDGPAVFALAPDPAGTDRDLVDIEANYRRGGGRFGVLETLSRLTAAIALYERHGFVRHHPEPLAGRRDQGRVLTLS